MKNFGKLAKPLTDLLRKNSFIWCEEATHAFEQLKQALISTPVLSLSNFKNKFIVEIDVSSKGIRVVLMQDQHPITYIGESLGPKK